MKCPNCKSDKLAKLKVYWSRKKNPVQCKGCAKFFYLSKSKSDLYWSVVAGGMPFIFFFGFFIGKAYAPVYLCLGLVFLGLLIQQIELKKVPLQETEKPMLKSNLIEWIVPTAILIALVWALWGIWQ